MSAASVRVQAAADCHIRSAVDNSHRHQQGNHRAGSSVASDPVRGDILNGLGAGVVGGRNKHRIVLGLMTQVLID